LETLILDLERESADLEEIWKAEKASVQGSANVKAQLEQAR
jgi:ATP-dependent Clp protease ATP-binding subunit ClpB